jgi:serine/threonine protein kinase
LKVLKNWSKKVLQGLAFLHSKGIVHGKLTCESIYINSNTGEIKLGDIGIKHIYEMHDNDQTMKTGKSAQTARSELSYTKQYQKEQNTQKFDAFCFGLALLEMVYAETVSAQNQHPYRLLCRCLNNGKKDKLLGMLQDATLRDFLSHALDKSEERWSLGQLQEHEFFKENSLTDNLEVKIDVEAFQELVQQENMLREHTKQKFKKVRTQTFKPKN